MILEIDAKPLNCHLTIYSGIDCSALVPHICETERKYVAVLLSCGSAKSHQPSGRLRSPSFVHETARSSGASGRGISEFSQCDGRDRQRMVAFISEMLFTV
jgi:hypothetical protein